MVCQVFCVSRVGMSQTDFEVGKVTYHCPNRCSVSSWHTNYSTLGTTAS